MTTRPFVTKPTRRRSPPAPGPHAYGNFLAVWGRATVAVFRDDPRTAMTASLEAQDIAGREGFAMGGRYGYIGASRDWAAARLGESQAVDDIAISIDALQALGAVYLVHHFYALHADACIRFGRIDDAMRSIATGLALVDQSGEAWWAADLHRLRGVAMAEADRDDPGAVESVRLAIRLAEAQGAVGLVRRASETLAELRG